MMPLCIGSHEQFPVVYGLIPCVCVNDGIGALLLYLLRHHTDLRLIIALVRVRVQLMTHKFANGLDVFLHPLIGERKGWIASECRSNAEQTSEKALLLSLLLIVNAKLVL